MIYCCYSSYVQNNMGYPEFLYAKDLGHLGFKNTVRAECIFEFKEGKTIYIKNRYINPEKGHQFSEEEILLIKLKAKPL